MLKGPIPRAMAHFFNSSFVVPGTSLLLFSPGLCKRHWSFKLAVERVLKRHIMDTSGAGAEVGAAVMRAVQRTVWKAL